MVFFLLFFPIFLINSDIEIPADPTTTIKTKKKKVTISKGPQTIEGKNFDSVKTVAEKFKKFEE